MFKMDWANSRRAQPSGSMVEVRPGTPSAIPVLLCSDDLMAARMIRVKVIPRSAKSEIAGELADGTLKVRLAAVPEKGRANEALIVLLADHFGVPASAVTIASGHGAQRKLVRVE